MSEEQKKWGVVKFSVAEADIAKKRDIYMDLTVDGPDDEEGYKAVDTSRKVMKADRVAIQKREKELKADANAWRKRVGDKAKELYALIEPIEEHLKAQCKIVTDEKERIKKAEKEAFDKKIADRMNEFAKYQTTGILPYQDVAAMEDAEYEKTIAVCKIEYENEQTRIAEEKRIEDERLAKIAKDQKSEADRLEKIRIKQERIDAEQKKALEKANAEILKKQAQIEEKELEIKKEQDRLEREKLAKEANEKALIEAQKAEQEKLKLKIAEMQRQEELMPDKEKCIAWVESVRESLPANPVVEDRELRHLIINSLDQIKTILDVLHKEIEEV